MNFDKVKIRCSAIKRIMGKTGLGKTGTDYLTELYVEKMYGRSKELKAKYIEKGLMSE
jgi:hypothetical protein